MLRKFLGVIKEAGLSELAYRAAYALCVAALLLSLFVVKVSSVVGMSMYPTFRDGDLVMLNRLAYSLGEPKRGDIITFPYMGEVFVKDGRVVRDYYVKRVIGLPGDEIDLRGGAFYINGERFEDEFSTDPITLYGNQYFPVTVPYKQYFVLGDNRNHSSDSRYYEVGMVARRDIYGRAILKLRPMELLKYDK